MAHQAHNIPWNVLASNFKFQHAKQNRPATNLYPRNRPTQSQEIRHFMRAFTKNIHAHADVEMKRLQEKEGMNSNQSVDRADIIITNEVMNNFRPFLKHTIKGGPYNYDESPYTTSSSRKLEELPLLEYRELGAFLPNRWDDEDDAYFANQLFKLLILQNEMDPIIKICKHPEADLFEMWECQRGQYINSLEFEAGWHWVPLLALQAYIILNLLVCYPELWDPKTGKGKRSDYRNTGCYQNTLQTCTNYEAQTHIAGLPHRRFFGIPDYYEPERGWYRSHQECPEGTYKFRVRQDGTGELEDRSRCFRGSQPCGQIYIRDFLDAQGVRTYHPTESDVLHVRWCLTDYLELPTELADYIMEIAEYQVPFGHRLKIPHDPLHPRNREELDKYLKYCWGIVIRCEVIARLQNQVIPWQQMIYEVLRCSLNSKGSFRDASGWKYIRNEIEHYFEGSEDEWAKTLFKDE